MTANISLLTCIGVLTGCGCYLLMERSLTRVLLGFLLLSNGVNLMLLHMAGAPGKAPIISDGLTFAGMTDPLPQALILTAIVITLGVTVFLLAMIYRSWRLQRVDLVADDVADRMVAEGVPGQEEDTGAQEEEMPATDFGERDRR
ncbi:MAG: Na(+)/H(+) antiporter subunit C [Actinomycetota bacterium]|nr:Na(+)/H(+) antiporter subunit C [Actinomycetota bacterium]